MPTATAAGRRIGILGSGDVGRSLARGLAQRGHEVKIGSRDAKNPKLQPLVQELGGKASAGTFAEAAAFGEILILATQGAGTEAAIDLAGPKNFDGKTVIDTTNPLDVSKGMPPTNFTSAQESLAERIQKKLPSARVVKCFNTVSHSKMVDPKFAEATPSMMTAGNDAAAKKQVEALLRELGWPGALDVGDLAGARYLEALVPLWVRVGSRLNTWGHAFKVVT